jgi:hypothetical protein
MFSVYPSNSRIYFWFVYGPAKYLYGLLPFLKYFILQAIYFGPDEYRKPFDILVRSFAYPKLRISRFLSFHLNVCVFLFYIRRVVNTFNSSPRIRRL